MHLKGVLVLWGRLLSSMLKEPSKDKNLEQRLVLASLQCKMAHSYQKTLEP